MTVGYSMSEFWESAHLHLYKKTWERIMHGSHVRGGTVRPLHVHLSHGHRLSRQWMTNLLPDCMVPPLPPHSSPLHGLVLH